MINPDEFADAVNKSMAEVREAMQQTAERLEAEIRRLAGAAGVEVPNVDRMREGNEQLRDLLDSLRDETVKAAGQVSDGMNDLMGELRRLLEATMPGWAPGGSNGDAPDAETATAAVAAGGATVGAAKKSAAKKSTKKAAKKSAANKSTKKSPAKKSAKKSTAKKATKKTTKKAAAKKSATKKTTAKKATKKSTAKKAAKKTTKKAT